jgi:hypothetical protein
MKVAFLYVQCLSNLKNGYSTSRFTSVAGLAGPACIEKKLLGAVKTVGYFLLLARLVDENCAAVT